MILLFKYDNKYLKFTPHNENYDFVEYANNNLPNGTPYKITDSVNITDNDCELLLQNPDGISNNSSF